VVGVARLGPSAPLATRHAPGRPSIREAQSARVQRRRTRLVSNARRRVEVVGRLVVRPPVCPRAPRHGRSGGRAASRAWERCRIMPLRAESPGSRQHGGPALFSRTLVRDLHHISREARGPPGSLSAQQQGWDIPTGASREPVLQRTSSCRARRRRRAAPPCHHARHNTKNDN